MKDIFNNIRASLKPALSVILSAIVVYSGLLLCCQVGLTSIRPNMAKAKSCCHASAKVQWKHKADHSCTCCGLFKNVLDRAQETISNHRVSSLLDLNYIGAVDCIWQRFSHKNILASNSQGPPPLRGGTPLYIQHSNLRL